MRHEKLQTSQGSNMAKKPGTGDMFPRGSDRGWHRGHHQQWEGESRSCNNRKTLLATPRSSAGPHAQPVPALRGNRLRPYRGGYNAHRERGNYRSAGFHDYHDNPHHDYHDYHDNPHHDYHDDTNHDYHDNAHHDYHDNSCHDFSDDSYHMRDYDEGQFQDYNEHRYHEERPYHERREPGYRRGRATPNHYRGGSKPHGRGDSAHNKHSEPPAKKLKSPKSDKTSKKEDAGCSKNSTVNTVPIVVHNPGRNVVVLTSGDTSEDDRTSKTTNNPPVTNSKVEDAKPIPVINAEAPASNSKSSCEQPNLEKKPIKPGCDLNKKSIEPKCDVQQKTLKPGCDVIKKTTQPKEEPLPAAVTPKEEEIFSDVSVGKRPHAEVRNTNVSEENTEGEADDVKRRRTETIVDGCIKEELQIPLLDGWVDVPSQSTPGVLEQTATKQEPEKNLSDTTKVLRTAFILAKKEQIELAYAQDCKTFAFVANMLLKKEPSMEAIVARALRSTLQEIAGRCAHELSSFIERYDMETSELMESTSRVNHTHN